MNAAAPIMSLLQTPALQAAAILLCSADAHGRRRGEEGGARLCPQLPSLRKNFDGDKVPSGNYAHANV